MSQVLEPRTVPAAVPVRSYPATTGPAHQAYMLLSICFTALPIVAGLDKFFHVIADWDMYLAPKVTQMIPVTAHNLMLAAGVVEIIAGLIVAFKPQVGAWIVTLWLWAICVNLFLIPGFYDIALRDFALSLGALALARLAACPKATMSGST